MGGRTVRRGLVSVPRFCQIIRVKKSTDSFTAGPELHSTVLRESEGQMILFLHNLSNFVLTHDTDSSSYFRPQSCVSPHNFFFKSTPSSKVTFPSFPTEA